MCTIAACHVQSRDDDDAPSLYYDDWAENEGWTESVQLQDEDSKTENKYTVGSEGCDISDVLAQKDHDINCDIHLAPAHPLPFR